MAKSKKMHHWLLLPAILGTFLVLGVSVVVSVDGIQMPSIDGDPPDCSEGSFSHDGQCAAICPVGDHWHAGLGCHNDADPWLGAFPAPRTSRSNASQRTTH